MKRIILIALMVVLLLNLCSCITHEPASTEAAIEPTVLATEPIVTLPAVTEPIETVAPTEPPEPTIPSLGEAAGPRYECYYSDEHDDFLNYYVHVPENAVENMPLIVYLHGNGEVNKPHSLLEYGISSFAKEHYGDDFPFIILEPNTRIKSWTRGDIPELLIGLIDRVTNRYSTNPDKIILTGFSQGAIGVWGIVSIYGDYFSAAVPVSSPHSGDINYLNLAKVPFWTFAGDVGDTECWYHKYLAQNVDQITVLGGFGKFTILEGSDHNHAPQKAYTKEVFDWMLAQQRGVIPEE